METRETTEKERLEMVISNEGMKSSQFAEEIGIKTPTLSHILNGRNNPSLDVMQRILNRFKYINSDWLILGRGEMYSQKRESTDALLFDNLPEKESKSEIYNSNIRDNKTIEREEKRNFNSQNEKSTENSQNFQPIITEQKKMEKIIVYYDDNSFEEFTPTKK